MAQTRGTFSQLSDNTDRMIFVMLDKQLKRLPGIWKKVTNVEQSDRATEISLGVVGFDDVPEKPEGQPYALAQLRAGFQKTVTHTYRVTPEGLDYLKSMRKAMTFLGQVAEELA